MTTLQEYLNEKYSTKEDKEKVKQICISFKNPLSHIDGGELNLSAYPNLEEVSIYGGSLKSPLTKLELGKQEKLTELTCMANQLVYFATTDCPNLKELNCSLNQLTSLDLFGSPNLTYLDCQNNLLTNLDFLTALNPKKIDCLAIYDNNIEEQNLSVFSQFTNLETSLGIGNYNKEKIENGIYNHFVGSLEPLKSLNKLKFLEISNTDIDSGLEYLPESIEELLLFPSHRPQAKVKVIIEELGRFDEAGLIDIHNFAGLLKLWKNANREKIRSVYQQIEQSKIKSEVSSSSSKKSKNTKRKEKLNTAQEQINQLQTELEVEKTKNTSLQKELSFYKHFFDNYFQSKKTELIELRSKLNKEEQEWLDIYCEASQETEKSSFVKKQLTRAKENLKEKLSEKELELILNKQAEISELENQLNNLQIQEAQIEIPPK